MWDNCETEHYKTHTLLFPGKQSTLIFSFYWVAERYFTIQLVVLRITNYLCQIQTLNFFARHTFIRLTLIHGTMAACWAIYSAVLLIQALLIQTGDYGPCWAHCIYTLYLKQIQFLWNANVHFFMLTRKQWMSSPSVAY